MKNELVI